MNWQKTPRFIKCLLAFFGGYFWLSCPICGEKFAGFETSDTPYMYSYNDGKCVCQKCGDKAAELNKRNWKTFVTNEERKTK